MNFADIRKRALKQIACALAMLFDRIALLGARHEVSPAQRVLIVKLDLIGDYVLWINYARILCNHYRSRGKSIVLLGNAGWTGWAHGHLEVDEIWELDVPKFMKTPSYRAKWLRRIRQEGFEVAVQPTFSRDFLTGDCIIRASAAAQRLGPSGDTTNTTALFKRISDPWYTQLFSSAPGLIMELRRHAEFTTALTSTPHLAAVPRLPRAEAATCDMTGQPYAVLFVGASWSGRVWPSERFAEICRRLIQRGLRVVVAGGRADMPYAAPLLDTMQASVHDLVGKTSLAQLVELLRAARVVVTNETSAMHMATAVGTAVVSIVGGGHFGRFAPYEVDLLEHDQRLPRVASHPMPCFQCNWRCKFPKEPDGPVRCISSVTVEQVWTEIEATLD